MPPHRVLVVDDEVPVVMVIRANLQIDGYQVIEAYNGVEALEKVSVDKPDLILLDVMMPEMDGWTTLAKLKKDPELADVPVVMLTALSQDADVARGWELGVDCYLTKPFEPEELMSVVRRLLAARDEEKLVGGE